MELFEFCLEPEFCSDGGRDVGRDVDKTFEELDPVDCIE
jgi:hypothetical protein